MTINAVLERLPEEALAGGTPRPGVKPKAPGKPVDDNAPVELVRGVSVQTLTPALRQRHDVAANVEGVIVIKVEQNSRAAAMGLEEGDVITQINRQPVAKSADARKIAEAGDPSMLLRLVRKGGMMLLMINNE
jgi:serine protease Do